MSILGRRPGLSLGLPGRLEAGVRDEGAQAKGLPLRSAKARGRPAVPAKRNQHPEFGRHAGRGLRVMQRREPLPDVASLSRHSIPRAP